VRATDVTISRHSYRIDVFLADHRLEVRQQGQLVQQITVGVAAPSAPAPGRFYFTTELVKPPTVDGPLGAYAWGVSASSDVLAPFTGAPGQFGIHGTNDPASVGGAVESGSIRLRNADITVLASFLPVGVPVTVNP
jgi:lipoprotein-anchoring transpeptidase ErfK/SrfK